jgi:GntR family transcriptional regulator
MDSDPADRRQPVWLDIRKYIQDLIASPGLRPGDRVPSERALAETLAANRMTVRKALDSLVAMGALERNSRSGTRIPLPRVTRPVDVHTSLGIARIVRAGGGTPGNRLLLFSRAQAEGRIADRLGLSEGDPVVVFRRLWTVNETPFCIETSHLPAARVPGLAAEDLAEGKSFYGLLGERYGITTTGAERTIGIGSCTETEAPLLGLKPGAAILLLRLLASDAAGRPIEYMTSVNHPQLVEFRTTRPG